MVHSPWLHVVDTCGRGEDCKTDKKIGVYGNIL